MDVQPVHARADVLAGRFVLERVLGTGGMATVWSARDTRLHRTVALKILRPDVSDEHAGRIEREARAAARIDDHRVVTVLDLLHTDDGTPFLVFEALSGQTLADELRESGALPLERAQRLASDLLGGLAAAHDCGVLHRDIKPSNVLIDGPGFRLTDFGIASVSDETSTSGDLMGTLVYLAPERFAGERATPRSDVFSSAAVLYECLSGRQPFRADSAAESLAQLRAGRFDPLPPEVPAHLARAVADGLDPDPERRPANAGAFAERVDPSAIDPTEHVHVGDPTERLDRTARIDQPTQAFPAAVPDAPAPATATAPAPAPAPPRSPRRHSRPAVDASRTSDRRAWPDELRRAPWVTSLAAQARRPQTIFLSLCVVLLVLLLFAASTGTGSDGDPAPQTPEEQLDQHLDRIEELGR